MIITFGQLLELVGPFLGRAGTGSCTFTDPATRLKAASLIQEYVQRSGSLKKWCVYSRNNTFTLPRDLSLILKVKINDAVSPVHSKWYEFYDQLAPREFDNCGNWQAGIIQEVNDFPTVYDMASCGGHVLAEIGKRCKVATNVYTIIQGISADTGEDVYTTHKGELIHGERLDLESGVAKRTRTRFKTITNITKSETDDYVKYYQQATKESTPSMLSLLAPKETIAEFRRAKILDNKCDRSKCYKINILGRLNVLSDYHDNDIIPITDLSAIETIAQAKQSATGNNLQAAGFKYQLVDRQIEDAQQYNRVQDSSIDVDFESSPGSIDSLI